MREFVDQTPRHDAFTDSFPRAFHAVKTGEVEVLIRLLHSQPELANARSLQGRTLLHHACDFPGHYPRELEAVRALLAAGADVNARAIDAERGETALQWAASNNDAAMIEQLIDGGAPVDGLHDDRRPLAQALWYGCPQAAEALVRRGAALDLELAAGMGRADLLPAFFDAAGKLLPAAGCHHPPVTKADEEQHGSELLEQALIYAVLGGSVEAAAYLLDRGADIHARPSGFDNMRATPLHWAAGGRQMRAEPMPTDAEDGGLALAQLLLERGASLSATDLTYNSTPRGWAEYFKQPQMVKLLDAFLHSADGRDAHELF